MMMTYDDDITVFTVKFTPYSAAWFYKPGVDLYLVCPLAWRCAGGGR